MPPPTGHILILCTANICRSPMAEGLLKHALAAQPSPWKNIPVISAGVSALSGERVSQNSVLALKKAGVDISSHRSQPVTQALIDNALIVLGMTRSHIDLLEIQAQPAPKHLRLFRDFMPDPNTDREVPDPFGGPLPLYEAARDELVAALPSLVAHIKSLVPAR